MAFNGAGIFTRLYNFVADAAALIPALPSRFDAELNGIATALSNCVLRDGTGKPIAPMDFGGQSLSNVGPLTASAGGFQSDGVSTLQVRKANGTATFNFSTSEAFVGNDGGNATAGAGRLTIGINAPSGDDSAVLITRNLVGTNMFRHAVRDETAFASAGKGAFASYDTAATASGAVPMNHLRGFQCRMVYSCTGLLDEYNSFGSFPTFSGAGSASLVTGFHAYNAAIAGGATLSIQYGVLVDALTGAASNFAFYAAGNPSYLGGTLQINGTLTGVSSMVGSGQVGGQDLVATGTASSYAGGGGVSITASGVQSYSNSGGTGKALTLNQNGGQVIVGSSTNTTAAALEVNGGVLPHADNVSPLGSTSFRWSTVYAGTGAINTSDERHKADIESIPDAWLDAWGDVQWTRYRFVDGKRAHVGLVAQRVRDAFAGRGLDATEIGLLCFDSWDEQHGEIMERVETEPAVYTDEVRSPRFAEEKTGEVDADGNPVTRLVPAPDHVTPPRLISEAVYQQQPSGRTYKMHDAGDRWGLRYDECFALEAAWQRRRMDRLEARLAALAPP